MSYRFEVIGRRGKEDRIVDRLHDFDGATQCAKSISNCYNFTQVMVFDTLQDRVRYVSM